MARRILGLVLTTLALLVFFKGHQAKPQVYDCFLFFNEFELLKIRLHEMSPYVDKFVLVESKETFRGEPKPLYFAENQELFKEYRDKIIHVVVEGHFEDEKRFHRERHQRNQIIRGLKNCKKDDIILISDVDEIVRGSDIPKIVGMLSTGKAKRVTCNQKMYMYYLNRFKSMWSGTAAITFRQLQRTFMAQPTLVRKKRTKNNPTILENCGWHFSYMGGITQVLKKVAAYSHMELDTPEGRASFIQQFREAQSLEPIDSSFPKYVIENLQELTALGFVDL